MSRPLGKLIGSTSGRLFRLAGEQPDIAPVAGMMGMLLSYIAADADDHVANDLAAAHDIRRLLDRARAIVPADLSATLDQYLGWEPAEPADFRGARIARYVADLRLGLILAQTWLETAPGSEPAALLDDIWRFLKADADEASKLVPHLW